ncbi:hypothetical protein [Enterococcus gallinarum]|uniref:hypothetical protein n=1 Tax=Enterococcus gallinarum TaxID=1353 RepID=UPI003DA4C2E1
MAKIKCPKCRSTDVEFMSNNRKGFSAGKAAAGAVLTGGIGLLAGFAGKKAKMNSSAGNVTILFCINKKTRSSDQESACLK